MEKYSIKHNNTSFKILCDDSFMCNHYLKSGLFYENKMLDYIKENKIYGIYLDIGAFIGNHSIFFSEMCSKCTEVISYEPVDVNYSILKENTEKYPKIKIKNVAVGYKSGKCEMNKVEENMGMCFVQEQENGSISMISIDDEFINTNKKIGLIKIDVEGYELEVLKGAISTIERFRPHLFIEIINSTSEIESFLKPLDYKIIGCFNSTPTYHFKPKRTYRK